MPNSPTNLWDTRITSYVKRDGKTYEVWTIPRNLTARTPSFTFEKSLPPQSIQIFLDGIQNKDADNVIMSHAVEAAYLANANGSPYYFGSATGTNHSALGVTPTIKGTYQNFYNRSVSRFINN